MLISSDDFDEEYCKSLLKRALKKKSDAVIESIQGFCIEPEQKLCMQFVRKHLNYLESEIEQVDSVINSMVKKHEGLITLLCTIPGINRNSAITVISEIGDNMSQFGSSKRLCC